MYKKIQPSRTTLNVNKTYVGETIEQKINRIVNNKEPIKDGAPPIYTDRKDGVQPQYDVRTDRMEVALEAMDKVSMTHKAKREERIGKIAKDNMEKETKEQSEREAFKNEIINEFKKQEKPNAGSESAQGTT